MEGTLAIIFTWARRMECELSKIESDLFIHALELKVCPLGPGVFPICLYWEAIRVFAHALREWAWPRAHINVTTFTRLHKFLV